MRISARLLLAGLFACVSTFAAADSVNISLQTAYCFIQHSAPCDGGLAQVTNNGSDGIKVDSIVASGWLSGHTDDITGLGGPAGGVQTISGGSSLIFNSFLFGNGDDTSNDGTVADASKGIVFTIHVTDTVDGAGATFTFYDNAASQYAFVDGPCVAIQGIDADASPCITPVTNPGGTITGNPAANAVPEPGSIALLGTGLLGLAGSIRRKFLR